MMTMSSNLFRILAGSLLFFAIGASAQEAQPVNVETSLGRIVGLRDRDDAGVDSFLGIQFARVGPERFKPSILIDDTNNTAGTTINATSYGPSCYQSLPPGALSSLGGISAALQEEECLHLNIWRPSTTSSSADADSSALLPTMVFIHGGAWRIGSGSESIYNGAKLAKTHGLVVVTINYRLGLFGGLVTGEGGQGGANFLYDQVNALRWVQSHIAAFGGDPNNVTIFGESAGSVSACMLSVSPLARGLFQRAVLESGECAFGIILPNTPEMGANITRQVLNLTGAASVSDLANVTKFPANAIAPVSGSLNVGWLTVDGWVLPDQPRLLFDDPNNVVPIDMIIGSNSYDSALAVLFPPEMFMAMASNMEAEIRGMLGEGGGGSEEMAAKVLAAYSPAKYNDNQVAAYAQFWGDFQFRCASRQFAAFVSSKVAGKIFLYNFAYLSDVDPIVMNGLYDLAGIDDPTCATHAAEIPMVFGTIDAFAESFGNGTNFTSSAGDLAIAEEMMARWATFARTGDPNVGSYLGWNPVPGESSEKALMGATPVQTFIFRAGGGQMATVQDKIDQCSAFYPSQLAPPTEPPTIADPPEDSATAATWPWHGFQPMVIIIAVGVCLL